jgi:DNA-binding NarL/FixJ family response regulator
VIALSMHADGQYVVEMLRAGASGYLLKDCAEEDLAQAIRVVQANLTFLSPGLADSVAADYVAGQTPSRPAAENQPNLTPRELEVLKLLAQGLPAKAVAQQLTVSLKTIETHRQHIMEKLEIHNIAGLTKYAIRAGLVELGE